MAVQIRVLTADDLPLMDGMLSLFAEVFDDAATYSSRRPGSGYFRQLIGGDSFIALVALKGRQVVGAIAAYELHKFEQERSEIYIYDLAVAEGHRREGIATALIEKVREVAVGRGAYVIFVQADTAEEDAPAIALYTKMGKREEVLHFDIAVPNDGDIE